VAIGRLEFISLGVPFQRDKTSLLYNATSTQCIIDRPTLCPWAEFNSRLCFICLTLCRDTATDHQRLGCRLRTFSTPCSKQHSFLNWALFHLSLRYSVKGHADDLQRF